MTTKIRNIMDKIMQVFNAVVFSFLTILTTWQVIARYVLGNPSTMSEELSSYMFAWVTLLGAAYVFGMRDHMNISILVDLLSEKWQWIIDILNEVIILIFAGLILIYGGYEITTLTMNQMSSSLPLSMGFFYASVPISGVFVLIYSILNIIDLYNQRLRIEKKEVV